MATHYQANTGFVRRTVAGNEVLICVGENIANFNGYILLNPTAAFLWDALAQPRDVPWLTQALTKEFQVDPQQATADVEEFLRELEQEGMIRVQNYEV